MYLYAHANGALFVLEPGRRSRVVTLSEAIAISEGCQAAGYRVVAAWDDAPIARAAVDRIRAVGVSIVPVEAEPPQRWDDGTTALMEAAAVGNERIVADLIDRGVDLDQRDVSGSTALHHAAARGEVKVIDALVGAGATADLANRDGLTPYDMAVATRQDAAAARLSTLGAARSGTSDVSAAFAGAHVFALFGWLALPLPFLGVILAATWPPGLLTLVLAALVLGVFARVAPPAAFWRGGAPRRMNGARLTLLGLRGTRTVDLSQATALALGGSPAPAGSGRARWLLLAHPDGHPVPPRSLRRLRASAEEAAALGAHPDRVVVIPVEGHHRHEVILAIGNALSARGVALSPAIRAHLAVARQRSRRAS